MTSDNSTPFETASEQAARQAARNRTRAHLQQTRKQLDPVTVARHSDTITLNLAPLLGNACSIAAYLAFDNEVSVDDLMWQRRAQGQFTYVPIIQPDHTLLFAAITDDTTIVRNKYAIREPIVDEKNCLPATSLDIVIVPLLGFDPLCQRMGMGGGYYDRTFAFKRNASQANSTHSPPVLIGVAFESQCVNSVLPDWWDVPLDHVVTEQTVYSRQ